ncbi:hypothetical protein SLNWT_6961 [Streptomyces albus]|uniref:Uncharacterized protein n=1 Tax=Streptomyces albus (strain ATCC 21838 / DSM 41398 / FERM P-419 / JCM 4703 / NBRC 107858) TaxID=1081613 RepID=A0A0B5FA53_STRA4|nr:hypothetical protein SLNWT_6961 [Streptomyces albus]AOU81639.1 hypothetical protein SLNHY_6948 [Streptomyces albus]AYN37331.1 hypothetical protein DUI70_6838 [Streptomyces albus]
MTTEENSTRSVARGHLSQLIDMFGTDGCLRISTTPEPGIAETSTGARNDEPLDDEQS